MSEGEYHATVEIVRTKKRFGIKRAETVFYESRQVSEAEVTELKKALKPKGA